MGVHKAAAQPRAPPCVKIDSRDVALPRSVCRVYCFVLSQRVRGFIGSVMFLRPYRDGILLNVKVRPNTASRLPRLHTDAAGKTMLVLTVSASPEHGKANEAACSLIAKALGVPASTVSVERGARSAQKTLKIIGLEPERAMQLLTDIAETKEK